MEIFLFCGIAVTVYFRVEVSQAPVRLVAAESFGLVILAMTLVPGLGVALELQIFQKLIRASGIKE